jgi:hypothetical protein
MLPVARIAPLSVGAMECGWTWMELSVQVHGEAHDHGPKIEHSDTRDSQAAHPRLQLEPSSRPMTPHCISPVALPSCTRESMMRLCKKN